MKSYYVAQKMLERGVQTIPLDNRKKPTIFFKNRKVDSDFIDKNIEAYQSTSVLGVLTRSVWCIDIDIDHVEGVNGFDSLKGMPYLDELTVNIKSTLVQTTPSGGRHIIFRKRLGVDYRQKIGYFPGVDIKAHPNNYFVLAGSVTDKGKYEHNGIKIKEYDGTFEQRIFSTRGSFEQQTIEKYSVKNVLYEYDFSHLDRPGKGGLGKQAYQRIIDGKSQDRNNDLYLAATYAKQCKINLDPLKILVGDIKNGDEFTESEWIATVESANDF